MCEVMIFAGTTEGRRLAEFCQSCGIEAAVSVATEYGGSLLAGCPDLKIYTEPTDGVQMEKRMAELSVKLVIDATHPYAVEATSNIKAACESCGVRYVRVLREETPGQADEEGRNSSGALIWKESAKAAALFLETVKGPVLLTTGSKELPQFANSTSLRSRLYARVLPLSSVIESCKELGLEGRQLIAMQGPFGTEINVAMIRHTKAAFLVTKDGGAAGGFLEKLQAAKICGIPCVVIGRPVEEDGFTEAEARALLMPYAVRLRQQIYLIGIGMGGKGQMSGEASDILRTCQAVLGAQRMLESAGPYIPFARKESVYLGEETKEWIIAHPQYETIAVLFSGDTGFYSGAKSLIRALELGAGYEETMKSAEINRNVMVIPGVSTLSYLCSRLKIGWEDVFPASCHGRACGFAVLLRMHPKVFLLLGGQEDMRRLCLELLENGFSNARLHVGERLSYEDENIVSGTPKELLRLSFGKLAAVLIERNEEV